MKRHKWTSYTGQAQRAHYSDNEDWRPTFEEAARLTRRSATADCDVVGSLVYQYETALKEGENQRGAFKRVEDIILKAVDMGLCPKENHIILAQAIEAGEVARKAMNPLLGDPNEYETRILAVGIHAAQEMIKANPVALELPFIRKVMMYILREQKYGDKPYDMRARWGAFLASRHGLVKLTGSPESYRRLVKKAKADGVKVDTGDDVAEGLAAVAHGLGVSESKLIKYTADKKRGRGRPPKK